jgi:dTDP-4-dehydrorhamnose 3,5-epimerase
MKVIETALAGVLAIEPDVFADPRGFFFESWSAKKYAELGLPAAFVQDNVSRSSRGILRGLHLQSPPLGQGKLVYVLEGEVFDVAVDVRVGSPTFGKWAGAVLSAENHRQLYVPPGFAHGFCVLSDTADVMYKQAPYYEDRLERGIAYNDPDVAVAWPKDIELVPSQRDANAPLLRDIERELPFVYERVAVAS